MLKSQDEKVWTGFIWLRRGAGGVVALAAQSKQWQNEYFI